MQTVDLLLEAVKDKNNWDLVMGAIEEYKDLNLLREWHGDKQLETMYQIKVVNAWTVPQTIDQAIS